MLELARALAARPRVLLLDEVMAGLRPAESDRIVSVVRELHAAGMTVLLIEHVMRVVMALAGASSFCITARRSPRARLPRSAPIRTVIESYLGKQGETGMTALLQVRDLDVSYGEARALNGVSLTVARNSLTAVVGSNGAGKTSLVRAIAGMIRPRARPHPVRRGRHHRPRFQRDLRAGHRAGRGGPRRFFQRSRSRKILLLGGALRRRARGAQTTWRACSDVSAPGRTAPAEGRNPFRRRAADAGDRPLPDGRSADSSCSTSLRSACPR